jgi:MFS family permease
MMGLTRNQRVLLIVLALINFFNYLDRQIIFPLFDSLKLEFGLDDFRLGLLGTVFMIVHSVASLPLAYLADKYSRKMLIAGGVAFWSAMTFASGLATGFKSLLGIRALVGIGEASYSPAATAMISDNFPQRVRAQAQGVFGAGMFTGGTVGAMLGGLIVHYLGDWRYAFFLVAIPGFILAWLASRLEERVIQYKEKSVPLAQLFRTPAYALMVIAGTFLAFAAGGYISWGIAFVSRYKGFDLRDTSIFLGLDMMIAGLIGVFLGSYLADRLHERTKAGRSLIISLGLITSVPFMLWGLSEGENMLFFLYFFIGTVLMSFHQGPAIALTHDLVPPKMRATASAAYALVVHLIGASFAPAAIGYLSDHVGLMRALQAVTWLIALAGLLFLVIAWLIHTGVAKTYEDNSEEVAV